MNERRHLDLLNKSATQYRWASANLAIALLCVALATWAFMLGHIAAGLLTLVVSVAVVWNSDAHKKRADIAAREREQI